ncbi:hypothetical protein ENBRE01_0856 [Enteropsectra breve]|nr:hypothetical protein ENBRE01_0856 [Enteropsectra breve]
MAPLDRLCQHINSNVVIGTTEDSEYHGRLLAFDIYSNMHLDSVLYKNGGNERQLGSCMISGNIVAFVKFM